MLDSSSLIRWLKRGHHISLCLLECLPNSLIVAGEWVRLYYDLFAISRVLPTVPRIRIMGDVGRFVRLFTFLSQAGIIGA